MRKEIKKQLQTIMDQAVKDNQIAGMNMMVIKDGQEEAYLQCGYADKANGKMIERDTIFRLFSMTKPITAAAAMILFERGVIDLADPVSRYIPGFADQMVSVPGGLAPVWHNVTVYHLLSMKQQCRRVCRWKCDGRNTCTSEYRASHDNTGICR